MKVFLLYPDRDFDPKPELHDAVFEAMRSGNLWALNGVRRERARQRDTSGGDALAPPAGEELARDLELRTLWEAMAGGDEFLFEMARRCVLSGLRDPEEIRYRQEVLRDCLEHPAVVGELYGLAIDALAGERRVPGLWTGASPGYILSRSVRLLEGYLVELKRLRRLADERAEEFCSAGFIRLFTMIRAELSDDYLQSIERYLREMELARGVIESAELGPGDKGGRYMVHQPPTGPRWRERLTSIGSRKPEGYSFELHPRDEAGGRYLEAIRGHGLNHVANAVAQSADHVQSFFAMLRLELAFYLACVNLHERLERKGAPMCFPDPLDDEHPMLSAERIYDVCLALHLEHSVIENDLNADGRSLIMITGANQGGKSTLLRAIGLAQLLMQAGMFVGAATFRASVCAGVFTHYKREEDARMEGGKLDEELSRMSDIADRVVPGSLLLCNESFASTNEREGSEIARQVIRAMLAKRIRVLFVTHMYDLAHSFHAQPHAALFLRAERGSDGGRTFKLHEGSPCPTSYGQDSYRRIFGIEDGAVSASDNG